MQEAFATYLHWLSDYVADVRLPGFGAASEPMPLAEIFVDLRLKEPKRSETPRSSDRPEVPVPATRDEPSAQAVTLSAADALASYERIALLAEPGQGKTTLLRRYAWELANDTSVQRIPLLVEFRRQRNPTLTGRGDFSWLRERLPETLTETLGDAGWAGICALLNAGNAIVLLDGFDELTAEAQRQIGERIRTLAGNQIVLASRPHAYRLHPLRDFVVLELRELDAKQVDSLAEKICRGLAPCYGLTDATVPSDAVKRITSDQTASIVRNPLLLSFLCLTAIRAYSEAGKFDPLPTRVVSVIRACISALVDWHRSREGQPTWPSSFTAAGVIRILAPLALETFENATAEITEERLEQLPDRDRQMLFECLVPAHFLEHRFGVYTFPLETFREYFASQALAIKSDPFRAVERHLHDPAWQQVVVFTVASLKDLSASPIHIAMPSFTPLFVNGISPLIRIVANLIGLTTQSKPLADAGKKVFEEVCHDTN